MPRVIRMRTFMRGVVHLLTVRRVILCCGCHSPASHAGSASVRGMLVVISLRSLSLSKGRLVWRLRAWIRGFISLRSLSLSKGHLVWRLRAWTRVFMMMVVLVLMSSLVWRMPVLIGILAIHIHIHFPRNPDPNSQKAMLLTSIR